MRVRKVIAAATVAASTCIGFAGAASATPGNTGNGQTKVTSAEVIGVVKIDKSDPGVATVMARYRCTVADPVGDPSHLWVSVKQNAAGTFDPKLAEEGSGFGGTAARWEDSHRNPVDCDGKSHVGKFSVDQFEGKQGVWQTLTPGTAWVQFCLFDDTTPKGDGQTDFGQPVSSMVWAKVL
jgi:hypothetical protein